MSCGRVMRPATMTRRRTRSRTTNCAHSPIPPASRTEENERCRQPAPRKARAAGFSTGAHRSDGRAFGDEAELGGDGQAVVVEGVEDDLPVGVDAHDLHASDLDPL